MRTVQTIAKVLLNKIVADERPSLKMEKNNKLLVVLAFFSVYVVWGSTYLAVVFALKGFPPFILGALRFLIAGAVLYAYSALKGNGKLRMESIRKNSIVGILALIGGTFSIVWVEQYLPSGLAAIIVAALPFWYVLIDKRQWKNYFSNAFTLSGVVAGFIGILLLFGFNGNLTSSPLTKLQLLCIGLLLLGCISWVIGSLYAKYHPSKDTTEIKVSIQLLAAGIVLLVGSFFRGEWNGYSLSAISSDAWWSLLYLAILGSVLAYNAFIWLLERKPPVIVGTYAYVNPVIAVLLGLWLAKEKINTNHIAALGCILFGVLLINIPKYKEVKFSRSTRRNQSAK